MASLCRAAWACAAGRTFVTSFMRYGELEIAVTSSYQQAWHDTGSGASKDGKFFGPGSMAQVFQGWRVLAHVGHRSHTDLSGKRAAILAREVNPSSALLREPVDYQPVAKCTAGGVVVLGTAWRPVPPPGYVSLGDIITPGTQKPGLGPWTPYCVRKDAVGNRSYVREAEIGDVIWDDRGSGAKTDIALWAIKTPGYPADSTERLLLGVDGFVANNAYSKPSRSVYVLDLPPIISKQYPPAAPVLTSHQMPEPRETLKVTDRAVLVPCTLVADPSKTASWQVSNSPFYTLERRVNFYCQMHYDNSQGNSEQEPTDSVTTGVSKEKSEEFSKRTSVTVTASAGIEIKAFSASLDVSVTTELGYSSRYGVTQFEERTQTWPLKVPPRHSAALWSPRHEIIALRNDGDPVGGQGGLSFDVDSRIYTQHPLPPDEEEPQSLSKAIIAGDPQPFGEPQSQVPGYTG
ncbi:Vps62-related protein [Streptomyces lavendulae]|uniref:Vps62-related protein n=1 Tax=Streptomyces lavendulae TaxID=1914 RepID=UPI0033E17366